MAPGMIVKRLIVPARDDTPECDLGCLVLTEDNIEWYFTAEAAVNGDRTQLIYKDSWVGWAQTMSLMSGVSR